MYALPPAILLANPHIGLIFVVPGVSDTFRVNGRATITVDADLLAPYAVERKPPLFGVLIDIDEAYTQCFVDPSNMPTGGQVMRAIHGAPFDAEQYDTERAERYRKKVGFY